MQSHLNRATPAAPRLARRLMTIALTGGTIVLGSCIHTYWRTDVVAVHPPDSGTMFIKTPLKAHLVDGRTVVFRGGATIDKRTIVGQGTVYGPNEVRYQGTAVAQFSLDSVVGIETFEPKLLTAQTVAVSTAASALTGVAAVALLKAIFGSCPTVYSDTGAGLALEAEGFSYAIAPLLEQRDVDPLRARPDSDGMIRLELRNEALETHYINHIELTAARHAPGERVMPDQRDGIVALSDIRPVAVARDRAGRNVTATVAAADGALYSSDARTVDAARVGDLDDWIDLEASELPPGDSVAVILRLRNSLLNTVLLYDGILGGRDAPEWLDAKLLHIASAIDLSTWYTRTMGLRATIDGVRLGDAPYHARLGDVGPLAFRDVAIVLPRPARNAKTVRVRLRFVADDWRIDYVAVAGRVRRPTVSTLPVREVLVPRVTSGSATERDTAALAALREPDDRYLQTTPGQRMILRFDARQEAAQRDSAVSYLITWQGWYREWIRGQWLAEPKRATAWVPGDSAVLDAMHRWRSKQSQMETAFYATKVPVR